MCKPYIICHMMTSIDGRIDCGMTVKLAGNSEYYKILDSLNAPTRITGKITAANEITSTLNHDFASSAINHESYKKNTNTDSWEIIMDTKGSLAWQDEKGATRHHLIITSEQVSTEYLEYLNENSISWIATGKEKIDLKRAMTILYQEFAVKRLAIVGGGKINGGFLDAGLIDELSLLIGPGADGRIDQPTLFDGRSISSEPIPLKLKNIQSFEDGAIWLRYSTKD